MQALGLLQLIVIVALPFVALLAWLIRQRSDARRARTQAAALRRERDSLRAEQNALAVALDAATQRLAAQADTIAHLNAVNRQRDGGRADALRYGAIALDDPPAGIETTYTTLVAITPSDPLAIPVGWQRVQGKPSLTYLSANPASPMFCGHILLTAKTRFGKDTWATHVLYALCRRNPIDRVQLVIIDGKQRDGALWEGVAHNAIPPVLGSEDLVGATQQLTALRIGRERDAVRRKVVNWHEDEPTTRAPLIVVFISELDLLVTAMGEKPLDTWLKAELGTSIASGIIYVIGTQNVANRDTGWRDHCLLHVAGFQDRELLGRVNLQMNEKEITDLGGVFPTNLAGPGFFTCRLLRNVVTVRVSALATAERREALASLPRAAQRAIPASTAADDGIARRDGLATSLSASAVLTEADRARLTQYAPLAGSATELVRLAFAVTGGKEFPLAKAKVDAWVLETGYRFGARPGKLFTTSA